MPQRSESRCAEKKDSNCHDEGISRRSLLHSAGLSVAGTVSAGPLSALFRVLLAEPDTVNNQPIGSVNAANAMGLVQFPCGPGVLSNTYHMMRAGESGLEAEGILSSNPLFLTNREDALTDLGTEQVEVVCNEMMSRGINPSVVKYSLAAKCIDSANIVATTMAVGRNRIVPEFTFMDARGAGLWDGKPLAATEAAIWAMDAAEAGNEGRDGKPPPTDDGTANETLNDQFIRLRQLMSVLETQYSGDSILLIFPDGTSPALLSCLIAGIPLKDVHALNFMPGEFREDVTMENSNQLLKERLSSPQYNEILSMGKDELTELREEHKRLLLAEEGSHELLITPPKRSEPAPTVVQSRRAPTPFKQYNSFALKTANDGESTPTVQSRRTFGDDDETNSPDIFSAGAMGAMGGLLMIRGDKDDSDKSETKPKSNPAPVLAYANSVNNSTGTTMFDQQVDTIYASANTIQMTAPANTIQMTDTATNPNVFEDVPVLSKRDRIEAAEKAMDEYLSQDDGGDAWLTSMQGIVMDEE